jgi:hypothetical protein
MSGILVQGRFTRIQHKKMSRRYVAKLVAVALFVLETIGKDL